VALGFTYLLSGRAARAEEIAVEALQLSRDHQYRPVEAQALRLLAACHARSMEDSSSAISHCQAAIALADQLEMQPELAHARRDLGELLLRAGNTEAAARELTLAASAYEGMRMIRHAAETGTIIRSAVPDECASPAIQDHVILEEVNRQGTGAHVR